MADLFGEWELAQAQGLDGNLGDPGGVNLAGFPNAAGNNLEQQRRRQLASDRARQQNAFRRAFATQPQGDDMFGHPSQQGFLEYMGPGAQGNTLQGMADQATSNIAMENQSRVSQAREARRQEHERAMMAMARNSGNDQEVARLRQLIAEMRAEMANNQNGIFRIA